MENNFTDRGVYLRNYVMGVLVSYLDKGLHYSNLGELGDSITQAVIEGEERWSEANCLEQAQSLYNSGGTS